MDVDVKNLQAGLTDVEQLAEQLLLARQEIVECDKARNGHREALTAMRKQARTSRSSVPVLGRPLIVEIEEAVAPEKCPTCGDHDAAAPMYLMSRYSDVFIRLPFHDTHLLLEKEQEQLEHTMKRLQSTVKEKAMSLSDKGGLSDIISPSLLKSFVTLKDEKR
ncbi:hypothetical protein MPTK2_1g25760 [Marchantia polymorpha subsp. ruderalis]